MLRFRRCAAGPAHTESGSIWGSTERASFLRLAEGSLGVYQEVPVGTRLQSKIITNPPIYLLLHR